jgi:hypothetical protein
MVRDAPGASMVIVLIALVVRDAPGSLMVIVLMGGSR